MNSPFDEARYGALLEGLEATELKYSEVQNENSTFRIDSEYFKKQFLKNIKQLKSIKSGFERLSFYIREITGGATPLGADYPKTGIPFIRVQNIMPNYFNLNDLVYITKEDDKKLSRSRLKRDDVLLTITGVSYGKSAVVDSRLANANINQHSVRIELKKGSLNPYFLSTLLNAKFGKLQSDQNIVGITRPALDYQAIKKFIIPKLSDIFQKKIELTISTSKKISDESETCYSQAEQTLLQALGLTDIAGLTDSGGQVVQSAKSFRESFGASGRLDAEYYQPKFEKLESVARKNATYIKTIGEMQTFNARGLQPVYVEGGELAVINSKHILENRLVAVL